MRLIAGSKGVDAIQGSRPDVAAAAAAVGLLVSQQPAARAALMQLRGLKPLLAMLHQGSLPQQSVASNALIDMSQGDLPVPLLHHRPHPAALLPVPLSLGCKKVGPVVFLGLPLPS